MVGSDVPFHLKFALKVTHPSLKSADFHKYLLITSQSTVRASEKNFNYCEQEVDHALSNEL